VVRLSFWILAGKLHGQKAAAQEIRIATNSIEREGVASGRKPSNSKEPSFKLEVSDLSFHDFGLTMSERFAAYEVCDLSTNFGSVSNRRG